MNPAALIELLWVALTTGLSVGVFVALFT